MGALQTEQAEQAESDQADQPCSPPEMSRRRDVKVFAEHLTSFECLGDDACYAEAQQLLQEGLSDVITQRPPRRSSTILMLESGRQLILSRATSLEIPPS